MKSLKLALAGVAALSVAAAGTFAYANHAWNKYHWSVSIMPLTVKVGDNVSSDWDSYLDGAIADWDDSSVIAASEVTGGTSPSTCAPVSGRIEVCNAAYGQTGWLGIAQIWLSNRHISQGVTKLNDTYFNTAQYNTPTWRALVTCQEIGHDFGLGHQDENFNTDSTTSCMDYTNVPAGNEHPDAHDYAQLESIYGHTHTDFTSVGPGKGRNKPASERAGGNSEAAWGQPVHFTPEGKADVFVNELGEGRRMITHVFWTEEARHDDDHHHH